MRNQKDSHDTIRQNGHVVKKSQKHDTNLQKNSTLYFQIGLIVCLLTAYGLLEMEFETKSVDIVSTIAIEDDFAEVSIENFEVYEESKPEPQEKLQKEVKLIDEIDEVDNDYKIEKELNVVTAEQNTSPDKPIDPGKVNVVDKPEEENIPVAFIQNVPIYPGCEKSKSNDERRKCMSDKITKLIQRKFEGGNIASDYGLTGKQKIFVRFTVDKTGHVKDIQTKAPIPELREEAKRVIKLIPEMTPGRQNNKNVGVVYDVPIIFQVE
ncbi:energy transducer TonB [Flavisericum labens]|uniref:energy transducer TonB n=1 Tax=Flavisericum labens TaxID=3377112 RepID=UPI00387B57B4